MEDKQQKDAKDQGLLVDPSKLDAAPKGIKNKLNPDEDAWAISAPPVHDIYAIRPVLAKNGIKWFEPDEKGRPGYYSVNLEERIIAESDPDVHMYPVFQTVTTRLGRGKQISTAAGFIKKMGFKIPTEADDLEIVKALVEVLKKEKNIFAEVDWRASYQEADKSWINVCSSMSDFPKDPDKPGSYLHRLRVTQRNGTPTELNAQLSVIKLYSPKEYKELSESGELAKLRASFGFSVKGPNTSQLAEEEEVVVTSPVKANGGARGQQPARANATPTPPVSEEKIGLALVEEE